MATYLLRMARNASYPFASIANWYNKTALAKPFETALITTVLKTSAADLFAQKVLERKESVDWQRNAVFSVFGFAYLGGFQYYLYSVQFVKWCKSIVNGFGKVGMPMVKVSLDQFVHHPFMYFPCFYMIKGAVNGRSPLESLEKYKKESWECLTTAWSIWIPAQLINFALVPRHLRVPFVALVSFGWCVALSLMQSQFDKRNKEAENKA